MPLAPVLVFVYNRPEHTKKTLNALAKNILASETDLFIFCDNYKRERDIENVQKVRSFVDEFAQNGLFRSITVCKAEKNKGLAISIISGVSDIIDKYGKVIVLEDDLVTSQDFLKYMNGALQFYKAKEKIWAISGYTFPMNALETYSHDIYMSGRSSSWGWATWKEQWDTIDWNVSDYNKFEFNYFERYKFARWGLDMPFMLDRQMRGEINSWAIRWCYAQFKQKKITVYPKISRVLNIGTDGSGTHFSSSTAQYDTQLYQSDIDCVFEFLDCNEKIRREFSRKCLSIFGALKSDIKKILLIFQNKSNVREKQG